MPRTMPLPIPFDFPCQPGCTAREFDAAMREVWAMDGGPSEGGGFGLGWSKWLDTHANAIAVAKGLGMPRVGTSPVRGEDGSFAPIYEGADGMRVTVGRDWCIPHDIVRRARKK